MVITEEEFNQAVEATVHRREQRCPLPGLAEPGRANLAQKPLGIKKLADLAERLQAIAGAGIHVIGHDKHISCLSVTSITGHSVQTNEFCDNSLPPDILLSISLQQPVTPSGGKVADGCCKPGNSGGPDCVARRLFVMFMNFHIGIFAQYFPMAKNHIPAT